MMNNVTHLLCIAMFRCDECNSPTSRLSRVAVTVIDGTFHIHNNAPKPEGETICEACHEKNNAKVREENRRQARRKAWAKKHKESSP